MRWVLVVLVASVVAWSVVASAQTMTIPAHFTKSAGGDTYKALARKGDTIVVQAYRDGSVELVTVAWQWKSEAPMRSGLERFERDLAGRSLSDNARVVSSSAQFDRDPMEASIFEALGEQRMYHRRLYAVDANNVVHVWWTICTAPSTMLQECGQAQRTMKLDIADAVTLPAESTRGPKVPPTAPVLPEPWHIVLPAGYVESDQASASIRATLLKALTGFEEAQARVFVSGPVRLLLLTLRTPAGDDAPGDAIANMDAGMTDGLISSIEGREPVASNERPALPTWGDNIVSRESFDDYARRTLYSVDARNEIYAFSAVCIGQRFEREDCEKLLESMRLVVPDQIAGTSSAWRRKPHQLLFTLLAVVAGVATILLIAWMRRRRPDVAT